MRSVGGTAGLLNSRPLVYTKECYDPGLGGKPLSYNILAVVRLPIMHHGPVDG